MDIYPLPLYMTPGKTCVKLYMQDDQGSVVTVGICIHNRETGQYTINLRRNRRRILLKDLGVRAGELYGYCILESKMLMALMERHPDKYLSKKQKKVVPDHPDGQVYTKYVEMNGEKERRKVMNQGGSVLILADE